MLTKVTTGCVTVGASVLRSLWTEAIVGTATKRLVAAIEASRTTDGVTC
jgi:hypothetical protein